MKKKFQLFILLFTICESGKLLAQQNPRPNILLIITDDMQWNSISLLNPDNILQTPGIDRIGNEGATVTAYSTNSLCIPARTAINSGKYGHRTGPENNYSYPNDSVIRLPEILHDNGYYVGLIGKWMLGHRNPRPEFNYWLWSPNQSTYYNDTCWYFNTCVPATEHMIDFLTDSTLSLISRVDTPFFLMLCHNAPHYPHIPQAEFTDIFDSTDFNIPANFIKYQSNYPSFLYKNGAMNSISSFENVKRKYMEVMAGVDQSINRILDSLQNLGLLDNTMVIFTTDNSYLIGEHKLSGKSFPYEECMRIPLLIRYPLWFAQGTVIDSSYSLNIDIAPTILDAAGIDDTFGIDGVSIHKVIEGNFKRKEFLYEQMSGYPNDSIPALRTFRDRFFQFNKYYCSETTEELFDMQSDPFQLNNLIHNAAYQTIISGYRYKLDSIRTALADTANISNCNCYLKNPVYFDSNNEVQSLSVLNISPNPASASFILTYNLKSKGFVSIYNLLGRLEKEIILEPNESSKTVTLQNIPSGIYFCIVKDESGKSYQEKLVVQK